MERVKIASFNEAVESLIDNQEEAQFRETQRKIRDKVLGFIGRHGTVGRQLKPTYLKLVKALSEGHASSVWSATKNDGHGRTINVYHYFGTYARQDARTRSLEAIHGLKELMQELFSHPEMKRPDMRRSKKFIAELLEGVNLKHSEFLGQTSTIGETTLQALMENDHEFWRTCVDQRGHGLGYRDRVATVVEKWFDEHPEVTRKLDRRIQDAWNEVFILWLKGYTA
jgi:hypothetical protein